MNAVAEKVFLPVGIIPVLGQPTHRWVFCRIGVSELNFDDIGIGFQGLSRNQQGLAIVIWRFRFTVDQQAVYVALLKIDAQRLVS